MSPYFKPGVIRQNQGASYKDTPGLYAAESGGVSDKVVVFSELSTVQSNLSNIIAQLDAAYKAADATDTTNWTAAVAALSQQIANINSGITQSLTVAARTTSLPSVPGDVPGLNATPSGASDESGWVLVDDGAAGAANGIYLYNTGTSSFERISQLPSASSFAAGTLVFVDNGTYENTFWNVVDDGTSSGVNFKPWGRAQDLDTDPAGFINLVANQLNANLDSEWFAVVGGELTLSSAFEADYNQTKQSVTTNATNIATNGSAISALNTEQTAQDAAISANGSGITANAAAITTNAAAISSNATDITDNATGVAANANDIGGLQTEVATKAAISKVVEALAHSHAKSHQIVPLDLYVDGTTPDGVATRTFYVDPGFGSPDFSISRLSTSASPFTEVAAPKMDYVTLASGNGIQATSGITSQTAELAAGSYAKVTFFLSTTMPVSGEIEAFAQRFFRGGLENVATNAGQLLAGFSWS